MTKPVEYRLAVSGFGTWRIAYDPAKRRWILAYNARARGEQWTQAADFLQPESAADSVASRKTSAGIWDKLHFALPSHADLRLWITDASEGIQPDAAD